MSTLTVSSAQFASIQAIVNICDRREAAGAPKFELDSQDRPAGNFYVNLAYKLMFELKIGKSIAWNTECLYNRFKNGMIKEFRHDALEDYRSILNKSK